MATGLTFRGLGLGCFGWVGFRWDWWLSLRYLFIFSFCVGCFHFVRFDLVGFGLVWFDLMVWFDLACLGLVWCRWV